MTGYLERSHAPYSWKPLAATYLIVLLLTVTVFVGISLLNEPVEEIVRGFPFATDIPGLDLDVTTNASQCKVRLSQTIRFVRLVPVPDQSESESKSPSAVYSLGREDQDGSALPASYSPIFNEGDLMSRLGITKYEIYQFRTLDDRGRHVSY